MELQASVDEADIARVAAGQTVASTVDAHGARQITGVTRRSAGSRWSRERRELHDDDRRGEPDWRQAGHDRTVRIETARNDDTLRVPVAEARLRPTADLLQADGLGDGGLAPLEGRVPRPQSSLPNGCQVQGSPAIWTLRRQVASPARPSRPGASDAGMAAVSCARR